MRWVLVNDGTLAWPMGTTLRASAEKGGRKGGRRARNSMRGASMRGCSQRGLVSGPVLASPILEVPSALPGQTLELGLEVTTCEKEHIMEAPRTLLAWTGTSRTAQEQKR